MDRVRRDSPRTSVDDEHKFLFDSKYQAALEEFVTDGAQIFDRMCEQLADANVDPLVIEEYKSRLSGIEEQVLAALAVLEEELRSLTDEATNELFGDLIDASTLSSDRHEHLKGLQSELHQIRTNLEGLHERRVQELKEESEREHAREHFILGMNRTQVRGDVFLQTLRAVDKGAIEERFIQDMIERSESFDPSVRESVFAVQSHYEHTLSRIADEQSTISARFTSDKLTAVQSQFSRLEGQLRAAGKYEEALERVQKIEKEEREKFTAAEEARLEQENQLAEETRYAEMVRIAGRGGPVPIENVTKFLDDDEISLDEVAKVFAQSLRDFGKLIPLPVETLMNLPKPIVEQMVSELTDGEVAELLNYSRDGQDKRNRTLLYREEFVARIEQMFERYRQLSKERISGESHEADITNSKTSLGELFLEFQKRDEEVRTESKKGSGNPDKFEAMQARNKVFLDEILRVAEQKKLAEILLGRGLQVPIRLQGNFSGRNLTIEVDLSNKSVSIDGSDFIGTNAADVKLFSARVSTIYTPGTPEYQKEEFLSLVRMIRTMGQAGDGLEASRIPVLGQDRKKEREVITKKNRELQYLFATGETTFTPYKQEADEIVKEEQKILQEIQNRSSASPENLYELDPDVRDYGIRVSQLVLKVENKIGENTFSAYSIPQEREYFANQYHQWKERMKSYVYSRNSSGFERSGEDVLRDYLQKKENAERAIASRDEEAKNTMQRLEKELKTQQDVLKRNLDNVKENIYRQNTQLSDFRRSLDQHAVALKYNQESVKFGIFGGAKAFAFVDYKGLYSIITGKKAEFEEKNAEMGRRIPDLQKNIADVETYKKENEDFLRNQKQEYMALCEKYKGLVQSLEGAEKQKRALLERIETALSNINIQY